MGIIDDLEKLPDVPTSSKPLPPVLKANPDCELCDGLGVVEIQAWDDDMGKAVIGKFPCPVCFGKMTHRTGLAELVNKTLDHYRPPEISDDWGVLNSDPVRDMRNAMTDRRLHIVSEKDPIDYILKRLTARKPEPVKPNFENIARNLNRQLSDIPTYHVEFSAAVGWPDEYTHDPLGILARLEAACPVQPAPPFSIRQTSPDSWTVASGGVIAALITKAGGSYGR